MKIIHLVLGKANPERMNGVNKVVHKLASVQHDLGLEVEVWGISNDLEHNYPPRDFKTQLFQQHSLKWSVDKMLKQALRKLNSNVTMHLHGAFIPEFYWICQFLVKSQIPYVLTPHGALAPGAMQQNGRLKKLYFHYFERKILQNAKVVQLLGWSGFENVGKMESQAQRILIPNGQDLEELPHFPLPKNEKIQFVFCGRLDRYHKGLDLFFEGFAQFQKSGGQASVGLIGNGKDRSFLERLGSKLGINNALNFYGARFGEEKFQLIRQGDVFFHTSRMEGFPMAVLEAAGMGMPCLVSEATNMGSYIRDYQAGRVLMENTPTAIAQSLKMFSHAHRDGQLNRLGKNARLMISEQFDWENIARRLIQVYGKKEKVAKPTPSLL